LEGPEKAGVEEGSFHRCGVSVEVSAPFARNLDKLSVSDLSISKKSPPSEERNQNGQGSDAICILFVAHNPLLFPKSSWCSQFGALRHCFLIAIQIFLLLELLKRLDDQCIHSCKSNPLWRFDITTSW
jgi:hypothetical protein